jgi:predicted PurR-regulated permease PerM
MTRSAKASYETRAKSEPATDEPERVHLHMPVDVRSLSLAILAALASIFALQWAKPIVVPVLLGVMFSYALTPAIERLNRWRVPRALGASVVLTAILAFLGWGAWALSDEASALIATLPQVAQKVRQGLEGQRRKAGVSPIEKMQQAANELEQAATDASASSASGTSAAPAASASAAPASAAPASAASASAASAASGAATRARAAGATTTTTTTTSSPTAASPRNVTRVVIEQPTVNLREYLWTGTLGVFAFLGQLAIVFFVTLFLLASGDTFRRKMVKLAGPRLSQKRITIQALDEVSAQIQRYLLVQLATSIVVGVATGLAFFAIGLDNAPVWGVVAAITNLVPYVGAIVLGAGAGLVGFMQFDSIDMALLIGASAFAIHGVVGNLLAPWWTGRASRMSPFAVFIGVLAFGWLWGAVGLILGTPILMVVKTVCDRVDDLNPVGEFLGA